MAQVRLVLSGSDADGLVLELTALPEAALDPGPGERGAAGSDPCAGDDHLDADVIVLSNAEQAPVDEIAARMPRTRLVVVHHAATVPADLLAKAQMVFGVTMSPARVAAEVARVLESAARAAATTLPREAQSATEARRLVRNAAVAWGVGGDADTLALLATELVANAVKHTDSDVDVTVRLLDEVVRVEVRDASTVLPSVGDLVSDREHGRGIALVDALAEDWGVQPEGNGKCVWFTLPRQLHPAASRVP